MTPSRRLTATLGTAALVAAVVVAPASLVGRDGAEAGTTRTGPLHLLDVAGRVGLDARHGAFRWGTSADPAAMMGGGVCWLDADRDGWMDLYTVNAWTEVEHTRWLAEEGRLPTSTLHHNDGGTYTDVGEATGAAQQVRGQGCLAADLDADGWTDLYLTTARSNVLLWNDGDGTFTADGGAAGMDTYGWQTAAASADVDGDGHLDVFVGGYVDVNHRLEGVAEGFPRSHAAVRDLLMMGDGDRTFSDASSVAGIDADGPRRTLGAVFTDVDGDGDPDLLVANDTDPNRLYRNDSTPGNPVLVDVAAQAGADDDNSGMGIATGDVDGDALPDLMVTNMGVQRHTLLGSAAGGDGRIAFTDLRGALGAEALGEGLTGWGVGLVDLDRDTDLDVLVADGAIPVLDLAADAQPVLAYEARVGRLVDATTTWRLDAVTPVVGRGSAVADHDNDGDPDVAVVGLGGQLLLLESRGGAGHGLVVAPDPAVPGTRVEVTLPDGRRLVREVQAGSSYLSTEDPRAILGVGAVSRVPTVRVTWPDGRTATVEDVAVDQVVVVPAEGRASSPVGSAGGGHLVEATPAVPPGPVPSGPDIEAAMAEACAGEEAEGSVARRWIEAVLDAVRRDLPAPTVHARNLYHLSAAMWDTWAAWSPGVGHALAIPPAPEEEIVSGPDASTARRLAVARAAHDVLADRYADAVGGAASLAEAQRLLVACRDGVTGQLDAGQRDTAEALGATVAARVLEGTADDGAAQGGGMPPAVNPPLPVSSPGAPLVDPDRWQPLQLEAMVSQNGIPLEATTQSYLGWGWGGVTPFAPAAEVAAAVADVGPPPRTDDPDGGAALVAQVVEVIAASSHLDPRDGVVIDISPGTMGDSTLGTDDGTGHDRNPATGEAYDEQPVPRADHGRAIAEFWADGPTSETPPGHWNTLAGEVGDALPAADRRVGGTGPAVDRLTWDVHLYLALNGAMHDAAVAAWGVKARYASSRPITLVRHLGGLRQRSDPDGPAYHPGGLPLVEDLIEVATAATTGPGGRHEGLADHVGEVVIRAWTPQVAAGGDASARVRWIPAATWVPYQRATFVTPAFAGYVSGHSTFSRAGAEVLTAMTGSPWFPGGLAEWTVPQGGLAFEDGPTLPVVLQWATYADAADQAGQSRIHGGIHIRADDHAGRRLGAAIGRSAWDRAMVIAGG